MIERSNQNLNLNLIQDQFEMMQFNWCRFDISLFEMSQFTKQQRFFIAAWFECHPNTGVRYLQMLQEDYLPVLQQLDTFKEKRLFWQRDGAPPHFFRPARE